LEAAKDCLKVVKGGLAYLKFKQFLCLNSMKHLYSYRDALLHCGLKWNTR
jgi:hypothetical protein